MRTFAFVADVVEITDLFADHQLEEALGLVMAGLPAGGVLDVDADSDYGAAFGRASWRSTARRSPGAPPCWCSATAAGNGNDPNLPAFEEITRRAGRRSG